MTRQTISSRELLPEIKAQLDEQARLLKEIQTTTASKNYINAREAARYLGISERLFNDRLKNGAWTCYRVGKRRVFRPCDLDGDLEAFKESSRYR